MEGYISSQHINRQFLNLNPHQAGELLRKVKEESKARGMLYIDDDATPRVIDVMLRPWAMTCEQARFFHPILFSIKDALKKLMWLYFSYDSVRQAIPLDEEEDRWVKDVVPASQRSRPQKTVLKFHRLFGRIDSNATFDIKNWRENFYLLEPNTVGVGGVHYLPCAKGIVRDVVLPSISLSHRHNSKRDTDVRDLLIYEIKAQAEALGRKNHNVALVENQDYISGTDEFSRLSEYMNSKGVKTYVTDPRHLVLYKGGIYLNGASIDIIYRDCEIKEFIEIEKKEGKLKAIRHAFKNHQVISSIAGEFDHKSAWELFTDDKFAKFFSKHQNAIFKKYCLWTRLVRPTKTKDPKGRGVDLIKYIRANKDTLVLKPNRLYGGAGVVVGRSATLNKWEQTLDKATRPPYSYVVQEAADVRREDFPVISKQGRVKLEKYFVVSGFFVTHNALACVGRFCGDSVVNVSRGGGLIAVFNI